MDGAPHKVIADAEGIVEKEISPFAVRASLNVEWMEFPILVGHLEPLDQTKGIEAQLGRPKREWMGTETLRATRTSSAARSPAASRSPSGPLPQGKVASRGRAALEPAPFPEARCPMGLPAGTLPPPRRATYADLEAVPANQVAELIEGTLYVMPRPASRHASASSALGGELYGPFERGRSGPGGWRILDEPELHFPDSTAPGEHDALVPDLAGWRRERMPELLDVAAFTLVPDWICEVLSKSTVEHDREVKMPIYARERMHHAWLVDPVKRSLEVYTLDAGGRWSAPVIHPGADVVHAPPFDAIGLDLSALWG